ncbi:MAG: sulfatase [Planctomycetota bacterium]
MAKTRQGGGRRPNIVLLVSDDHGLDLGCWGNPVIQTPNLDGIAADGVRLTNACCTSASCCASRSVILTGKYNHAIGAYGHCHGYHHFATYSNTPALPVMLNRAGYRTAHIGKLHVAPLEVYRFDQFLQWNPRSAVEMADKCFNFIADKDKRPFFLYWCSTDPHRSGLAEDLPYHPDRFGNRPEGYPGVKTVEYDPREVVVPPFLPDTPECRAELAQYYQSVSRLDQGVGRVIQILKETGNYENTLIIYVSDNGIAFPEAKTTVYDPGIVLPCIVRPPGERTAHRTCDAQITWADLTPTILDFAEAVPKNAAFHGRSFRSALEQEHPAGWDEIYVSHTFHEVTMYYPMRAIRTRRHKFIWNIAHGLEYPFASDLWRSPTWQSLKKHGLEVFGKRPMDNYLRRPKFELYDLEADPREIHNLAGLPAHAKTVEEFCEKIRRFQERTDDPWIVKWTHE